MMAAVEAPLGEDVSAEKSFVLGPMTSQADRPEKRLQVEVVPNLAENTTAIRCLDWDRDRFDIEFALAEGTTYNSYLIQTAEATCLVDTSHEKFRDAYWAALDPLLNGKPITHLVVSHTEPDHSGLVKDVVDKFPEVKVYGTKVCLTFLKDLVSEGQTFDGVTVKGGEADNVDLGDGHTLEFVAAPNLHWPDTMFTLDRKTGIAYTCDAFGQHFCTEDPYDTNVDELLDHYRFYYDCLMRPNSRSVLTALRKTKEWEYDTIAVGHGPILRKSMTMWKDYYATWSEAALEAAAGRAAVIYEHGYGYAERLSQIFAKGANKAGIETEFIDLTAVDDQEVIEALHGASGVVIFSPSSAVAEMKLSTAFAASSSKRKIFVAESCGGDDEPVDSILRPYVESGCDCPVDPLRIKTAEPTPLDYQKYEEAGTDFAQAMTKKVAATARKDAMNAGIAKSLGRIHSGLYVVAVEAEGGVRTAMIASWVTQASFEPLGITVAVAKDRAVESYMQVGDGFVLNILEEGKADATMKHFLKRYAPGVDRFEGIDYDSTPCGPVLGNALAHLQCCVRSRLDTGDHWVIYAEVIEGAVSNPQGRTASHRRVVATYY